MKYLTHFAPLLMVVSALLSPLGYADELRDDFFDEPVTDLGTKKDGSIHHTGGLSWSTGSDYSATEQEKAQLETDVKQDATAPLDASKQPPTAMISTNIVVLTEAFYPGKTPYTMIKDKLVERAVEQCPHGWNFRLERMMSQKDQMVLAMGIECFDEKK